MREAPPSLTTGIDADFFWGAENGWDILRPSEDSQDSFKFIVPSFKTQDHTLNLLDGTPTDQKAFVYYDRVPYICSPDGYCVWYTIAQFYTKIPCGYLADQLKQYSTSIGRNGVDKDGQTTYYGSVQRANVYRWAK